MLLEGDEVEVTQNLSTHGCGDQLVTGRVVSARSLLQDPWETAYTRFETPQEEVRKFLRRLKTLGASQWPRDVQIVELFCGRGNGLHALNKMGFTRLEGVDLSTSLMARYKGSAKLYHQDCKQLPFETCSRDRVIVHGGFHHLRALPEDLDQTLSEAHRVLKEDGLLLTVEPWLTPFLSFVQTACQISLIRRLSKKVDAFAEMMHHEGKTYEQWLRQPRAILSLLETYFHPIHCSFRWGKLMFVGRKETRQR